MDQDSLVLGIDLGTTSVKVAVVQAINRQCVHRAMADTSAVLKNPQVKRSKEQDVSVIFATLDSLVSAVPAQHKEKIRLVSVCGQMHGCVLWGNSEPAERSTNGAASAPDLDASSTEQAGSERESSKVAENAAASAATEGSEAGAAAGGEGSTSAVVAAASAGVTSSSAKSSESGRITLSLSTPPLKMAQIMAAKNTSEAEPTTPTSSTALSPSASGGEAAAISPLFEAMPRVVSALVTWEDGRCDSRFLASLPTATAGRVSTGFGCATLAWMERHVKPQWMSEMRAAGTVMDLLVACLTQHQDDPVMSEQCAASWGYYDWENHRWEMDALRESGFPCRFLPRTSPAASPAGKMKWSWHGVRAGTPVAVASGDMQCGVYSAMHRKTQAVLNIGTSAQVACLLPKGHKLPAAAASSSASSSPANNRAAIKHVAGKAADDAAASSSSSSAVANGDVADGAAASSSSSPADLVQATAQLNLAASAQQPPSPDMCTRGDTTKCKSCQDTKEGGGANTGSGADGNAGSNVTSSSSSGSNSSAGQESSSGGGSSDKTSDPSNGPAAGSGGDSASRLGKLKVQKKNNTSSGGGNSSGGGGSSTVGDGDDDAVSAAAAVPPLECWPYFFGQRLAVAASLNGGNVLMSFVEMLQAWVAELCAVAPHTDDVFAHLITAGQRRIREGSSGRGDVIVVPRFFGERHRPQSRASVRELSPTSTSLGGIFTALCRGLVKNLNEMMPVSFLKECHVDCLVGTGTALLRNGVLQAAVVESYGMRVEAVPVDDATVGAAYGAALVALDALQSSNTGGAVASSSSSAGATAIAAASSPVASSPAAAAPAAAGASSPSPEKQ